MTAALLGVACLTLAVATYDAWAEFQGPVSAVHATSSGALSVSVDDPATLDIPATGVESGGMVIRRVTLSVHGDIALTGMTLTTSATTSSALDTDATNGLQLFVARCTQPFDFAFDNPCPGDLTPVIGSFGNQGGPVGVPVIMTDAPLVGLDVTPGTANYLAVLLMLPFSAGNELQNLSSVFEFTFKGVQRVGVFR